METSIRSAILWYPVLVSLVFSLAQAIQGVPGSQATVSSIFHSANSADGTADHGP